LIQNASYNNEAVQAVADFYNEELEYKRNRISELQ